jgi:uncharacterized protein
MASWGIAFFEYCFQVPANRNGSYEFTPAQLKTIQEIITLSIFSGVFDFLSRGPLQVELWSGLCPDCGGSILYFPQMVD